jgi:hypothetical protein
LVSLHTGQPFSVYSSADTTGTNEGILRANQIGDPFAGVSHSFSKSGVQWVNPVAFEDAAPGTFGTSPRNGYYGPGYASVDFSVVKNTKITERIAAQLRVEMFNLFNRTNLAPPSGTLGSGFGISADTIGDYNGAPGIGPGEAFNIQLGFLRTVRMKERFVQQSSASTRGAVPAAVNGGGAVSPWKHSSLASQKNCGSLLPDHNDSCNA